MGDRRADLTSPGHTNRLVAWAELRARARWARSALFERRLRSARGSPSGGGCLSVLRPDTRHESAVAMVALHVRVSM